jgi:FKBP-type peptidyl-prolyl cis-trans isomerase SlyD
MSTLPIGPDAHVTVRYAAFDEKGAEVERTPDDEPLTYVHGYAQIVPGLERTLEGMRSGERRRFELAPEDAFGVTDESAVFEVDRADLGEAKDVSPGDELLAEDADGDTIAMRVLEVRDDCILVDANHPLAGRTLTFEVEVLGVREATDEEVAEAQEELEEQAESAGCCSDHDHDHDHDHAHDEGSLVQLTRKASS